MLIVFAVTSPTPYDPPITYGGFNQSRALGLRIASLLDTREQALNAELRNSENGPTTAKPKRKKHKVYIHSSPFQRCVQTSIGISAGLAQYQSPSTDKTRSDTRARSPHGNSSFQPSPRLHAVNDPRQALRRQAKEQNTGHNKTNLRVDAFLGEWLSPDYFEMITPPPNSVMMVAGAKADLLRKGEEIDQYSLSPNPQMSRTGTGNLWGSKNAGQPGSAGPSSSTTSPVKEGQAEPKTTQPSLPTRRDRAWSSAASSNSGRPSPFSRQSNSASNQESVKSYLPPTPHYAIAAVEPIPKGYVTHARDACVETDYQWDSMRQPLLWGDGGEFGEEWSEMHKRFRRGLASMVDFYNHGGNTDEQEALAQVYADGDGDDEDVEVVVVMVTHGAGCNALIGALTDQPVLLDVGMASISMAVRKDAQTIGRNERPSLAKPVSEFAPSDIEKAVQSASAGLSSLYEMKLVSSSEHLRPGVDPSRPIPLASSSPILPASKTIPDSRRRSTLATHATGGSPMDTQWVVPALEPGRGNMSAALGSMRRPSQAAVQTSGLLRNNSVGSTASSTGLWTPNTPPLIEVDREGGPTSNPLQPKKDSISADILELSPEAERLAATGQDNKLGIDYSIAGQKTPDVGVNEAPVDGRTEADALRNLPSQAQVPIVRQLSQRGLWGSSPSGTQLSKDKGPKRRWTVQQE